MPFESPRLRRVDDRNLLPQRIHNAPSNRRRRIASRKRVDDPRGCAGEYRNIGRRLYHNLISGMSESDAPPLLEVRGLHKQFAGHLVLDSVDLVVPRGSVVSLFGRSGTGKSVFLKCVAGLLAPDAGEIRFDRQSLGDIRRRCSYLFQSNALFDSLSAVENVSLPLEQTTRMSAQEVELAALNALQNLGLEKFAHHYPSQMSGGMQKRLALARALVTQPHHVLFDEPTAGLDPPARAAVFEMIVEYRRRFGFTAVVVTHDVAEALAASDRVALLEEGRIRFEGTPAEFARTDDCIVRGFGENNVTARPELEK
jgi:phospholipid/cholesterol/gamma-HCH transport system ATP-binding protein